LRLPPRSQMTLRTAGTGPTGPAVGHSLRQVAPTGESGKSAPCGTEPGRRRAALERWNAAHILRTAGSSLAFARYTTAVLAC
jgi:hypothetical protein